MKKLEKKPRYQATYERLGESWIVSADVTNELEKFTCEKYGYPRLSSVDLIRATMIKKMVGDGAAITHYKKINLSMLPPCRRSLLPHIKRVNYRVAQWKHSYVNIVDLPTPTEHGWQINQGILESVWSEGPILPLRRVDLLDIHDTPDEEQDSYVDERMSRNLKVHSLLMKMIKSGH